MTETKCAVVVLGPPGSGKTTLTRALAARSGASIIEVGNLLSEALPLISNLYSIWLEA